MEQKTVFYKDFGAVGDGVAEDFLAIKAAHDYANEHGCDVKADAGAIYYIGDTDGIVIPVMTNVDWGDATFILDDKSFAVDAKARTANIFRMTSKYQKKRYGEDSDIVKAINANGGIVADKCTNIGYAPGYDALLVVFNDRHSAYIRYGMHATGKPNPQRELIVVDKDGNIDPNTRFLLDYSYVSMVDEIRIDDEPITVEGGTFITKANAAPRKYTYYSRGLELARSNLTVKNVIHKIVDEPEDTGAPYGGFIFYSSANNILVENVTLQGHKNYPEDRPGFNIPAMGTYDIGGSFTTNVCFKNCHQSNFYKDPVKKTTYNEYEYWGIMGTNYCKNLIYDGCMLSRLDAHAGVLNVTIKDTHISMITLIGGGVANIENSVMYQPNDRKNPFISLRGDYGSTWKGDIIIKDCKFIKADNPNYIVGGGWNNWNFGYTTYLPNVTVDNLEINTPGDVYIFSGVAKEGLTIDMPTVDGEKNLNPMVITPTVTVKNNKQDNHFIATPNSYIKGKINFITE